MSILVSAWFTQNTTHKILFGIVLIAHNEMSGLRLQSGSRQKSHANGIDVGYGAIVGQRIS